jgi:hypothetical protein
LQAKASASAVAVGGGTGEEVIYSLVGRDVVADCDARKRVLKALKCKGVWVGILRVEGADVGWEEDVWRFAVETDTLGGVVGSFDHCKDAVRNGPGSRMNEAQSSLGQA